ncbi:DUF423 domain-containing protein [Aquisalimonas sp. 2447]|uniref:DUF423 domain-containing protein n=1 Tax=Aquisalimonas sp. 2447 TaxID=2740807 RepID=UPI00143254A3|nr:DUF423 domain-containing protein [Aquisalimonas sp. 2447]QIT54901.1 DUF423 domain-containing protein [Aquisalimonas sp. 2447]
MNPVLIAGALLGLLSVVVGASAEHLLQARVDDEVFRWVMTAIRYHQVGALIVSALGLALIALGRHRVQPLLRVAGWLFVAGTVLFSFSIYGAALTGVQALTYLTPLGGVTLMLAWAVLIGAGFRAGSDVRT